MSFIAKSFALIVAVFTLVAFLISFAWPSYEWHMRVPSPDGQYDLIVLRGDAAAFDDFSYNVYIFPHESVPPDRAKGTRVWLTPIWRNKKYLVYSGYNYPMFRWTDTRSVEIDLNDSYEEPFTIEPVRVFENPEKPILVSVAFGKENNLNALP